MTNQTATVLLANISQADQDRLTKKANLERIRGVIAENKRNGTDNTYEGLQSWEIGLYNGAMMFGDNDEAFPSQDEWSRIVD